MSNTFEVRQLGSAQDIDIPILLGRCNYFILIGSGVIPCGAYDQAPVDNDAPKSSAKPDRTCYTALLRVTKLDNNEVTLETGCQYGE
ncbi:hypothetical protein H9L39_16887 [Fusarium oxysporum f. sp. albedinis]|nr:hypothetical protein H9L39_16887 [Fusarium oxysporum f. sp. albedinis]